MRGPAAFSVATQLGEYAWRDRLMTDDTGRDEGHLQESETTVAGNASYAFQVIFRGHLFGQV